MPKPDQSPTKVHPVHMLPDEEPQYPRIPVLDHGYVRLVEPMGRDLSVVNAAKVSFAREATFIGPAEERILNFLGREEHTSPFRHAFLSFEIYAPLMVARQWWKHVVGSDHTMDAWNESSRRYVTEEPVLYFIEAGDWRSAPENRKQGSGGPLPIAVGARLSKDLRDHYDTSLELYERAITTGVAVEQARVFLPAYALYVRWRWTGSVQSVAHFLRLRLGHGAQYEIMAYADVIQAIAMEHFPYSIAAYLRETTPQA